MGWSSLSSVLDEGVSFDDEEVPLEQDEGEV